MKKRFISLILAICCVLTLLPMVAVRADAARLPRQEFSGDRTLNPLYEDVLTLDDLPQAPERLPDRGPDAAGTHDHEVARPLNDFSDFVPAMDAVGLIRDQLVAREEEFTIQFAMVSNMTVEEGVEILLDLAMAHTGVANEGDYLRWQWVTFDIGGEYWEDSYEGLYYVEVTYYMTYFTTAAQEAQMDAAVDKLLMKLDLDGKTDYAKVKTVYDYICENVTYDYEHLEDPEYYLMFSAYAALINKTAVCQGYALLVYRLVLELGVDTRIIVGVQTSTAIPHAWNIVQLRNQYYNLDSTWDAGMPEYSFFLRNNANFVDHTRDPAYNTTDFNNSYYMDPEDYQAILTGNFNSGTSWRLDSLTGVIEITGEGPTDDNNKPWGRANNDIVKLVVNEGVTRLGTKAFQNCKNLVEVSLPDSLVEIGRYAFDSCEALETIEFPENLTTIGEDAFDRCRSLVHVYIPDSVVNLGASSFNDCTKLESFRFPAGLKAIPGDICNGNSALKTVELPEDYEVLGSDAFSYCSSLESIYLPETLVEIGRKALTGCDALETLRIPASVRTIGYEALTLSATLYFVGDAPQFDDYAIRYGVANAYYPRNNDTWDTVIAQFPRVNWIPYDPPVHIAKQPRDVCAAKGEDVVVSVQAVGEGLTYKWYYKDAGNSKFTLTKTFTGNTYTATMNDSRDGRQIYCLITDKYGNEVKTDVVTLTMEHYATIVKQPESVLVEDGKEATVTVEATGDGLTYAWYYKNPGSGTFKLTTSFTGNTYSVTMSSVRSGRQVYCVITDRFGNSVTTDTVTLAMTGSLLVLEQPQSVKVGYNEEATVTVEALGEGLTYQWYYKNPGASKFLLTKTFTGNTYTVTMNADRAGRQVYCVITDKHGNKVKTDVVTLSMDATPLEITKQPENVDAPDGMEATVSVEATGDDLTYQWYYKNSNGSRFVLTKTFTGNTYTVTMNADRAGRQVYCVITDGYGNSVTTDTVTLTMYRGVQIESLPDTVAVTEGEMATVTVNATGHDLTYQWYYKSPGSSKFTLTTTFTGNTYSVEMNKNRAGRQVYCVVTDKYGNSVQSETVTLDMYTRLEILQQPQDTCAPEGEEVTVTVEAKGEGLTYAWYYKDAGNSRFTLTKTFTGNTYTATMTQARNGRQIYCIITDKYGNSVKTDVVTLTIPNPVTITKQPEDVIAANGSEFTITVEAVGDGLTYKWYYKNAGASSFKLTTTFTGNTYTSEMSPARDGRQVYCIITDKYGNSVKSDVVTMTMKTGVTITKQPTDVTVANGQEFTITVEAEGEGLTYKWYYKNAGASSFKLTTTFTGNTYTSEMSAARDGRQVYCIITDKYGNSVQSNTVTMTMADGIVIAKQPESVIVAPGEKAIVTVEAVGEGLTYEWYWRGQRSDKFFYDGAFTDNIYWAYLSSYWDDREVYCVITDKYGNTATTDIVTIEVEEYAEIVSQTMTAMAPEGEEVVVKIDARGDGLTYKWYYKNAGASSFKLTTAFTGDTYTVTMSSARRGRQIYCVVTDKYGNSVSSHVVTLEMGQPELRIITQPETQFWLYGMETAVWVQAEGNGLTYQWYYQDEGGEACLDPDNTTDTYRVIMLPKIDGRTVWCVITDRYGQQVTSDTAQMFCE